MFPNDLTLNEARFFPKGKNKKLFFYRSVVSSSHKLVTHLLVSSCYYFGARRTLFLLFALLSSQRVSIDSLPDLFLLSKFL